MARNIEIKAGIDSVDAVAAKAAALADHGPIEILQDDTFFVGRTRVHLDKVEDLGHFLELEVVLSEGEGQEPGVEEAHRLMAALGIPATHLIEEAYVDLLAQPRG
jgi:adenylate cyclase class IV